MVEDEDEAIESIEEIKERYGFADRDLVSMEEARELYLTEDVELSAPLIFKGEQFGTTLTLRLSIYKGQDESGPTGQNGLQLNIEKDDEGVAHTFLQNDFDEAGWTLDNVCQTFNIPKDAVVWEINEAG